MLDKSKNKELVFSNLNNRGSQQRSKYDLETANIIDIILREFLASTVQDSHAKNSIHELEPSDFRDFSGLTGKSKDCIKFLALMNLLTKTSISNDKLKEAVYMPTNFGRGFFSRRKQLNYLISQRDKSLNQQAESTCFTNSK